MTKSRKKTIALTIVIVLLLVAVLIAKLVLDKVFCVVFESKVNDLKEGMTIAQTEEILGRKGEDIGSGRLILEYHTHMGKTVTIFYNNDDTGEFIIESVICQYGKLQ